MSQNSFHDRVGDMSWNVFMCVLSSLIHSCSKLLNKMTQVSFFIPTVQKHEGKDDWWLHRRARNRQNLQPHDHHSFTLIVFTSFYCYPPYSLWLQGDTMLVYFVFELPVLMRAHYKPYLCSFFCWGEMCPHMKLQHKVEGENNWWKHDNIMTNQTQIMKIQQKQGNHRFKVALDDTKASLPMHDILL